MRLSGGKWEDYPLWQRVGSMIFLPVAVIYVGLEAHAWWRAQTQPDIGFQCTVLRSTATCVFHNTGGGSGEACAVVRLVRPPDMSNPEKLAAMREPWLESERICSGSLGPRESISKTQTGFRGVASGRPMSADGYCGTKEKPDSNDGCIITSTTQ